MKNLSYVGLVMVILITIAWAGFWGVPEASAAVGYRDSAATCNATSNPVVGLPAGTVNGDVMIMVINSKDNTAQATPTGWTRIGTQLNNTTSLTTSIFYRVANSEPSTYTLATTAVSHCVSISSYSGVNTAAPINASSQRANAASATITANAITPTVSNTEVIFISGYANNVTHSGYSGTNPTFAERFDTNTSLGTHNALALASGMKTDTTSTGTRTAIALGIAAVNNGFLIALAPASVGNINISGTCKQSDGTTDCADSGTVRVAVNGTLQAQTQPTVAGTWTISGLSQPASGAVITVFVDGVASTESRAVAVTTYDGSGDITGLELIEGALSLGNSDNRTLTNTNLSQYDNSVSTDADVFFDVSGTNLTVDSNNSIASELLYIKSGNTFAPGGNVTTASYKNSGTFTAGTSIVTFTAPNGVQTISGNLNNGVNAFYKVSFDTGAFGTASWIIQNQMKVSAANAIDTFVIKNGTVTMGDSNGDNLEVNGKMIIAGTAGETGALQTPALAQGNTITIDVNNNAAPASCVNCIISVGATSGGGTGSLKLKKNTILRLNPRSTATASDTGIEVQSTGYLEILGSQETTGTVASFTQSTSNTTLTVAGSPWTPGQFDGMSVRFTNPNSGSFGKVFDITGTASNSITVNAVTTSTDANPDVVGSAACTGNATCTINVADTMFSASRDQVGNYLHNIPQDKYYMIATTTEGTVDSLGIISNSPDDFTTMNDGDDVEITEGIRIGDSFEIIDYANVTAESGTACTSTVNQAGEGYIYAKAGSETLIRYADICNLGRGIFGKFGLFFESVNGANSAEGATVDKSRVRKGTMGVTFVSASNNNSGKGITDSVFDSNISNGIYFNSSTLNNIASNRSSNNNMGALLESSNGNTLSGNYIYRSSSHGMALVTSSRNNILGNTAYRNGNVYEGDQNIFLQSGSNSNIVDSNNSFDSITWGIVESSGSSNNTISNNMAHNNRKSGIVIADSNFATVFNNKSFSNHFHGLTQICNSADDATMFLFGNSFYSNDLNGLQLESSADCNPTVVNDQYGVLGDNKIRDLYMGAAGAPVPGNHTMNLYNVITSSPNEVSVDEMVNIPYWIISHKSDGTAGLTKIWGKYIVPANIVETPQDESKAVFNYANNLWEKSASRHGYTGTGTEDTNLDYDLTTADLSGGPYNYRATVKTAGNCGTAVFDVFRNNVDIGDATCGTQFTDSTTNVKFKIDGGATSYVVGDSYTFNVWDGSNDANTEKTVTMMQDKDMFTVPISTSLELKGQLPLTNVTQVTRGSTGGYQFTINGSFDANAFQFDYLGGTGQTAGLLLNSTATVTSLDNGSFNNFAVNNGTTDSFIQVNSALIGPGLPQKTITALNFDNATGNANCNLNSIGTATGFWEFLLSTGAFSGESFDCANGVADPDPGNFKWTP